MHWNDRFAADSVVGRLLSGRTDPISGQPESKYEPVRVETVKTVWAGLLVCRDLPALPVPWWVRRQGDGAELATLAGTEAAQRDEVVAALDRAFGSNRIEVLDSRRDSARYAWTVDGKLVAVLFLSPEAPNAAADWLAGRIGHELATPAERAAALAGRSPTGEADGGRTICACFAVGLNTLVHGIRQGGLSSVQEIGAALRAGTGCGSCVPELKALLAEHAPRAVAQMP